MPVQVVKDLISQKPIELTETGEHRIHRRKWWAIFILIVGGIMLAAKLPISFSVAYMPMVIVNVVWLFIDALGCYRWL